MAKKAGWALVLALAMVGMSQGLVKAQFIAVPEEKPGEIKVIPRMEPKEVKPVAPPPIKVEVRPPALPEVRPAQVPPAAAMPPPPKPAFAGGVLPGFLAPATPVPAGKVTGTTWKNAMVAKGDMVYLDIGQQAGAQVGDLFHAYAVGEKVFHPVTKVPVGVKVKTLGEIRLTAVAADFSQGVVTEALSPIPVGASLRPAVPRLGKTSARGADPKVTGYVIAPLERIGSISQYDFVFLDLGDKAGVAAGQLFEVYRGLAGQSLGQVLVLAPQEDFFLAQVIKSNEVIGAGAWVRGKGD